MAVENVAVNTIAEAVYEGGGRLAVDEVMAGLEMASAEDEA